MHTVLKSIQKNIIFAIEVFIQELKQCWTWTVQ